MKTKRINDSMTELEIKQAETISNLQEEIKLQRFDLAKKREYIRRLNEKIKLSNSIIKSSIKELKEIDDKKIHSIIIKLKSISRERIENEE